MIARLRGRVVDDGVLETTDGVGYAVTTPAPLEVGADITLHITMTFRETDVSLWGFLTKEDQATFLALRAVQGVGPSIAMAVLRVLTPGGLAKAVNSNDAKAFGPVPGVGAALAKRILSGVVLPEGLVASGAAVPSAVVEAVVKTLGQLGYSETAAKQAVEAAAADNADATSKDLLLAATTILASGGAA